MEISHGTCRWYTDPTDDCCFFRTLVRSILRLECEARGGIASGFVFRKPPPDDRERPHADSIL